MRVDPRANPERWHHELVALDPGIRSPGVALFRNGILVGAAKIRLAKELEDLPMGQRCMRVAQQIAAWWDQYHESAIRTIVFEWPQIYAREKSKGDPNKLVPLVAVGTAFATIVQGANIQHGIRPPELLTPMPAEWTGQVPKSTKGDPWKSPRGIRIWDGLAPGERTAVPPQHDAIDSVGLGLWALGRYGSAGVNRVFPGAAP